MDNGWFYEKMAASNAPSNPPAKPSTPSVDPGQPKKIHRWIFPIIVGIIILIFVPIVIIAFSSKTGTPAENPPEEQATNPYGKVGEPDIGYDEDLSNYIISLASEPDYEPNYYSDTSRYTAFPSNISCDALLEVKQMDQKLLNLYLDYGFVVLYSNPNSSILVIGGSLTDSEYITTSYDCPSPSDDDFYNTYNYGQIQSHLTDNTKYYVWIDEKDLSIVE